MDNNLWETIFAWGWWAAGAASLFAVCYEFYTLSDRYARKIARKNMIDENGQYYFDFMKKYL